MNVVKNAEKYHFQVSRFLTGLGNDNDILNSLINRPKNKMVLKTAGALPIMTYTVRLRPKAVPFLGFRCLKG